MNPETFGAKILLNIIDKLLIGIAAALVVMYFQENQRQSDLVRQERIAVSRVITEAVQDQQSRLMTSIPEFIGFVETLKMSGSARDHDAQRLNRLEQDIRQSIRVVRTIHGTRTQTTCEPADDATLNDFMDLVSVQITVPLLSGTMRPEIVDKKTDALLPAYADLLAFVRCLAIDTVDEEVVRTSRKTDR